MRYSIEPRDRVYVKGYEFSLFTTNMGTHATKVATNLSNKCSQKLIDSAKQSTTEAIKTASKKTIQKTAEATDDLIGNKIADTITSISKSLNKLRPGELRSKEIHSVEEVNNELLKERYVSLEKGQQIIDELRLAK